MPSAPSKDISKGAILNENEGLTKEIYKKMVAPPLMDRVKRSWIYRAIALIAGVSVLLVLVHYVGFEQFFEIVLQASPRWIAAAVLVYASSWTFRTWRLRLFTDHAGKKIGAFDLFKLYISGYALNVILPAKLGDVITVGYLKMKGIKVGRSAAIILQTRILDVLALVLLSIPALVLFFNEGSPEWMRTTLMISALVVLLPMGVVFLDKNESVFNVFYQLLYNSGRASVVSLAEKLRDAYGSYHQMVSHRTLLIGSILLSLAIWLFEGLTCYAISIAVGAQIPISIVVLAVSIGNVGKSVPATPGSIGIYESMLAAVLIFFGVSVSVAVVISILDHAIKNIFLLAVGVPATMDMGQNVGEMLKSPPNGYNNHINRRT